MADRNMPACHEVVGYVALLDGNAAQADAEFHMEPVHMVRLYATAVSQYSLGHFTAADDALSQLVKDFSKTLAYQIAEVYAWRGDRDKAFEWLETAYRQRDRGITQLRFDPLLANLRTDPRYRTILQAGPTGVMGSGILSLDLMVARGGIEPPTRGFSDRGPNRPNLTY
jgi:hypothetical protein